MQIFIEIYANLMKISEINANLLKISENYANLSAHF